MGSARSKDVIRLIGRIPTPVNYLTGVVDQPGQFDADDPAPIRDAFAADLLGAAPFAARVDQLNPIGVHHREEGRLGQKRQHILGMVTQGWSSPMQNKRMMISSVGIPSSGDVCCAIHILELTVTGISGKAVPAA
jgi:hypothetical protein